ncbi:MAG: hypothetical protein DYG89_33015 [Caldilinea sp. CFX5]|nr:hypothetical protein [Caldilinea sp. CFX5]
MQPIIHRTITITITESWTITWPDGQTTTWQTSEKVVWPDESVAVEPPPRLTATDDDGLDDQAVEPTEPAA